MARQILIALENQDRLSEFIPYIQEIAQPGMNVILLIRYAPTSIFNRPRVDWATFKPLEDVRRAEDSEESTPPEGKMRSRDSLDEPHLLVEQQIVLAEEKLRKSGVEIAAHVYTGSLKAVVRRYTRSGKVHFIMKRASRYLPMMSLFRRMFPILGLFNTPTLPPMLLLHPEHGL